MGLVVDVPDMLDCNDLGNDKEGRELFKRRQTRCTRHELFWA